MLPTEDLPETMMFEKRCIIEIPLIPAKHVDRVLRDDEKKTRGERRVNENDKDARKVRG